MKRRLHPKRLSAMRAKARMQAAMRRQPHSVLIGEICADDTVTLLKTSNTGAMQFEKRK